MVFADIRQRGLTLRFVTTCAVSNANSSDLVSELS
jgi:hypothetical protein